MLSNIILDISRYQPAVDFPLLKSLGQNYIIAKCASGSLYKDIQWENHYHNGTLTGMEVAPYFWVDPTFDAVTQAKYFLKTLEGKKVPWIVLDFEQWWASWSQWSLWVNGVIPRSEVAVVSSRNLYNHFVAIYEYIKANSPYKIVVYTAEWFLNAFCPQTYDYLKDKYTHWADWINFGFSFETWGELYDYMRDRYALRGDYINLATSFKTWSQLEALAPVGQGVPTLRTHNYPMDKVLFRQWSGDRLTATGVYSNMERTRLSGLDLNLWVNETVTLEEFAESTPVPVPEPDVCISKWKVTAGLGLNIRKSPTVLSPKIETMPYGYVFDISSEENGWGKLCNREGYTSLAYAQKITNLPPDEVFITKWLTVATIGLNIRGAPSISAPILGSFPFNTAVYITTIDKNNWGKLYDRDGYISLTYARKI